MQYIYFTYASNYKSVQKKTRIAVVHIQSVQIPLFAVTEQQNSIDKHVGKS